MELNEVAGLEPNVDHVDSFCGAPTHLNFDVGGVLHKLLLVPRFGIRVARFEAVCVLARRHENRVRELGRPLASKHQRHVRKLVLDRGFRKANCRQDAPWNIEDSANRQLLLYSFLIILVDGTLLLVLLTSHEHLRYVI